MAKVALLIGVSEYEPGLNPLPAATKDVEAMQRVLLHPEIGGFDDVTLLLNPQRHEMEEAIEILFDNRQNDDLVLLFFSGHGIKDESGKLYFAARNTRKTDKGVPVKATTVPANFVHEIMSNSRSRREVVILDCCFSGAFAEGMLARDDGFVDVRNQLGGEGRAVLTSSTSTQYSFEQQGIDTSTYTSYVVEGLETGAADRDEDGWISVDELHEYAAKKVQDSTPAMKPEIYPIRGGHKIKLAKAPSNDPMLTYRREVEYWVEGGNGEISVAGRAALEGRQEELELTPEQANTIETQVLAPIKNYKRKLQRYDQAFSDEIKKEFPLSDKTRANLKRVQQALGLRDEDIAIVEAPIIAEQPLLKPPVVVNSLSPQNSNFKIYIGACIIGTIGVLFGGTVVYFFRGRDKPQPIVPSIVNSCVQEKYTLDDRISLGEEILVKQDTNPDKEAGVQAFFKGDCDTAINKLNSYRQANSANKADPEVLIYLNNAKARQKGERLKISVSVPIGTNPNVAKEILRGVAQVQDEVNSSGGINNKPLEVAIANDNNNSNEAQQIASQFVTDTKILAVVGHNTSNASLSAAPIYQEGGLVMIAPTGFSESLSNFGSYIFRTFPPIGLSGDKLADYMVRKSGKTNIAICVDYKTIDNKYFEDKDKFSKVIKNAGGNINTTNCDLSVVDDFKAAAIVSQAKNSGADALFLAPHIDRIDKAIKIVKANKGQLAIFSSPALYTYQTLETGKADVNGMVLTTSWHPEAFPGNPFSKKAQLLWGGNVSWRTAMAYDAAKAIVTGLEQNDTRDGLQNVLRNPNFSAAGAGGNIQFEQGDRKGDFVLIQVQPSTKNAADYDFVLVPPYLPPNNGNN
ncbi:ABC transporter substrate-binding protein [Nostoc sp. KVJ20]|uniref:caspase, EACC1-associated type n=1 Tax=Nostoc sp. KVJ20 TaxID=457944 RepID=UPI00083CBE1D|nr:ABC transporter substrate-binding protein [Nostoc sp. KVJ20]ODG99286.1 ABC transporter substrate-binding protein [Nostoc sp. KVJ20]